MPEPRCVSRETCAYPADCACEDGSSMRWLRPRYRTIVVDPPWQYRDAETRARGAYPTLSTSAIKRLPVAEWAEADAHLYLWATNAFVEAAIQLTRAWGFQQKTILTWRKKRIGMGHYFRNNSEHIIFAVRGRLATLRHDLPTVYDWPQGAHSEKPAASYDIVESMSPGPYLDVFARKHRFGWDAWGDQVYCAPGLPKPSELPLAAQGEGHA